MTKFRLWSLFLVVGLLFAGCAMSGDDEASFAREQGEPSLAVGAVSDDAFFDEEADFGGDSGDFAPSAQDGQNSVVQERLIIRTGHLDIVVTDVDATIAEIGSFATRNGGWVVQSNVQEYSYKVGDVTVRVPAGDFDTIMTEIKALAVEVTQESSSGQDVTEEYVDLSARLTNLEVTAERVRSFLEEAETVEEALDVNQELSRLEGEIEVIKGRIQFLTQSAAFSTISVSVRSDEASQPIDLPGWQPGSTARNAVEALVEFLQGVVDFLIWFVIVLLPVILIIGFPIYLLVRFVRRRGARSVAQVEEAPAE